MSDENKVGLQEKVGNELKSDKKFLIRVVVIAILLVVGYYLFSPFQNCMRKMENEFFCVKNTGW